MDFHGIVRRTQLWLSRQLPPDQQLSSYNVHVSGADLSEPDNPAEFHTFACLVPQKEVYFAMGCCDHPRHRLSAEEIRTTVHSFTPSIEKILEQKRLIARQTPFTSNELLWEMSKEAAARCGLPVAAFAFGHTLQSNELTVYLLMGLFAPIGTVSTSFKQATPVAEL